MPAVKVTSGVWEQSVEVMAAQEVVVLPESDSEGDQMEGVDRIVGLEVQAPPGQVTGVGKRRRASDSPVEVTVDKGRQLELLLGELKEANRALEEQKEIIRKIQGQIEFFKDDGGGFELVGKKGKIVKGANRSSGSSSKAGKSGGKMLMVVMLMLKNLGRLSIGCQTRMGT